MTRSNTGFCHDDTICALATSARPGGIGIVRISGPSARAVVSAVAQFQGELVPHHLHYARFTDECGHPIDEGYVAWMPAPKSYTSEDTAELQGHGGAVNLGRLLKATIAAGARPAQRGEFTLRAFLHGRIDLSQAEAVIDVVQARTETALDVAHQQLRGGLSSQVREMCDTLIGVRALLEAQIDFVEEDLDDAHRKRPSLELQQTRQQVQRLTSTFSQGKVLREGARVVLVGAPNAGKSSLFNALLKESRAIVTDIPGTTRDFLEETMDLDGVPVTLVDTAGIREPDGPVEAAGVERTLALVSDADVVLVLVDATTLDRVDLPPNLVADERQLRITTKADLAPGDVSAVTGQGVDALLAKLRERVLPGGSNVADRVVITNARHAEALRAADEALSRAVSAAANESPEITCVEVQEALTQLGLIVGQTTTDDLLDRIFSSFCIGK